MTDKKEDAAPAETPKAHSQWKYTGEALGTVMPGGVPLVTIEKPGQVFDAADATQAARFRDTGHFEHAGGTKLPAPKPAKESAE